MVQLKNCIPDGNKKSVWYEVPCEDRLQVYISTSRHSFLGVTACVQDGVRPVTWMQCFPQRGVPGCSPPPPFLTWFPLMWSLECLICFDLMEKLYLPPPPPLSFFTWGKHCMDAAFALLAREGSEIWTGRLLRFPHYNSTKI